MAADLGLLSAPLFLAAAVFGLALGTASPGQIEIQEVEVPELMRDVGYTGTVVTHDLVNTIYTISKTAASQRGARYLHDDGTDRSVEMINEYLFHLNQPIKAAQMLMGLVPVYITGHAIEAADGGYRLTLLGRTSEGRTFEIAHASPDLDGIHAMIQGAAYDVLRQVDPYLIAVYELRRETPQRQFPRTRQAVRHCLAVCSADDVAWAHVVWGLTLFLEGQPEAALARYRQAIDLKPDLTRAHYLWGVVATAQGRFAEAAGKFSDALALDPGYAPAYAGWADALVAQGRHDEAVYYYRKAVTLDDRLAQAHAGWGRLLLKLDRPREALAKFRDALAVSPDHPEYTATVNRLLDALEPSLIPAATPAALSAPH